jgi:hypothetical protein
MNEPLEEPAEVELAALLAVGTNAHRALDADTLSAFTNWIADVEAFAPSVEMSLDETVIANGPCNRRRPASRSVTGMDRTRVVASYVGGPASAGTAGPQEESATVETRIAGNWMVSVAQPCFSSGAAGTIAVSSAACKGTGRGSVGEEPMQAKPAAIAHPTAMITNRRDRNGKAK